MFLGIEIGGTKLQMAVGSGDGTLSTTWRTTVDVQAGGAGIRDRIRDAIPEVLSAAGLRPKELLGVGVGFGGPVDDATGCVVKSHQITGWDGFPLRAWLAEILGVPVALGNDADVAGLGEALHGAGRGISPVFYVTIGSGIGGGLILDGRIHRGTGKGAAEIGHLRVTHQGQRPILEEVASGWAIARRGQAVSAESVARAARAGDPTALGVLDSAWDALAEAICHVIALVCPGRIVIGGGVSLMGEELLFEPLREKVARQVFAPFADCYEIRPAALGEEVVLYGALALARSSVEAAR